MRRIIGCATVLILISASCNLPLGTQTPLPPLKTDTPPAGNSTPSVIPIETFLTYALPTPTPTLPLRLVVASPKEQIVNCRFGPGIAYSVVGELSPGKYAEVIGKSPDLAWWQVRNPNNPSTTCWLSSDFTDTEGNIDAVPVATAPPVTVSAVLVSIDPPLMNVACDSFPRVVTITVEIAAYGPSNVVWMWREESTGDTSGEMSVQFEEGGKKSVQDFYQVRSARDYALVVQTLEPNSVTTREPFKAVCAP
ncbi:MAG: SH3 domain-containing protein [Anaerolineales bacterium]|nr:SH3 domain-containing protein [Anaerolineales bacterium]